MCSLVDIAEAVISSSAGNPKLQLSPNNHFELLFVLLLFLLFCLGRSAACAPFLRAQHVLFLSAASREKRCWRCCHMPKRRRSCAAVLG